VTPIAFADLAAKIYPGLHDAPPCLAINSSTSARLQTVTRFDSLSGAGNFPELTHSQSVLWATGIN